MSLARYVGSSLILVLTWSLLSWAGATKEKIALSLKQFSNLALKNSLRSRTAEENLISNRYSWMATRRNLTWPNLSAAASETKSFSDSDLGTKTETIAKETSVTLKQPFLTGTNLSLASTWSRSESDVTVGSTKTASLTNQTPALTLSFTQPLFILTGNESWRARREANLSWQNNQDAYWKEQLDIDFTARTLYYRLLLQTETTAIERKKAESARLVHDTTRALVRAGKLAEVELIRADISARQDGRRIQNAENDLEKAMNEAKDLISLPTEQTITLTSKLTYEPFNFPLDRLIKLAIEKNPDVQTSRRQVEVSEIALKRTRERDNPQLNTSGSYSLTRDRSNSTLPINPYSWNVKLGVDWPIYDADQTRLQTKQSEISYLNSKRSYENRIRQLTVDVQNAYLEVKRSEEQIADFEPQKLSAERNVQAIRLQYKNGLTRLTDVFDAENQLRDLELEYLRLLVTFNTARDQLKVLVGTDLSDLTRGSDQ